MAATQSGSKKKQLQVVSLPPELALELRWVVGVLGVAGTSGLDDAPCLLPLGEVKKTLKSVEGSLRASAEMGPSEGERSRVREAIVSLFSCLLAACEERAAAVDLANMRTLEDTIARHSRTLEAAMRGGCVLSTYNRLARLLERPFSGYDSTVTPYLRAVAQVFQTGKKLGWVTTPPVPRQLEPDIRVYRVAHGAPISSDND